MRKTGLFLIIFSLLFDTTAFCAKKKKKRRKTKRRRTTKTEQQANIDAKQNNKPTKKSPLSVGVNLGWESLYGNSISVHYRYIKLLGFSAGAGFNRTGAKLGLGSELFIQIDQKLVWTSTLAFVYSIGTEGQVSIDASFTPIDTGVSEDLVATKNYELSSGSLLSINTGLLWDYSQSIQFITSLTYNFVASGNEIELSEETSYDKAVEITNQSEFYPQLKDEATKQVEPGGPGFFVGLRFIL